MTGMACLSTVIAVLSFTLKLPQAFLDGQNSLSVLAAGLTAPDGARNLFAQRAPENTEAQSQLGQDPLLPPSSLLLRVMPPSCYLPYR